jgi:hypothetical protein
LQSKREREREREMQRLPAVQAEPLAEEEGGKEGGQKEDVRLTKLSFNSFPCLFF